MSKNSNAKSTNNQFGKLPEWDLSDLYPGMGSKELKGDLKKAQSEAKNFEKDFKGNLEQLSKSGKLIEAIVRYEDLSEITGDASARLLF